MSYTSPILQEIPSVVSEEDRERLLTVSRLDVRLRVTLYQEMVGRYSDSHPYFLVRLAKLFVYLKWQSLALDLFRKAQHRLSDLGIHDDEFNAFVDKFGAKVDSEVNEKLVKARDSSYYRRWKPTREHIFPTHLPKLPPGSEEIKRKWQELTVQGVESPFFCAYLRKLAIETVVVESVFLLTQESAQDLIGRGFDDGKVICNPDSAMKEVDTIRNILKDTLAAFEILLSLVDKDGNLADINKDVICRIHARLMKTCQFNIPGNCQGIPAGMTRTETRKTVLVSGITYKVECCPFPDVDTELEYICRMAKDGNGRLARMFASLPLYKHGYPPMSISLYNRSDYYAAITKASDGDHSAMVQCIMDGLDDALMCTEIALSSQPLDLCTS
ncbi:fido domain-containing protein [Panaeolus papilionaceus]|nr:fido domain-containing protein [Panaeolus papilionaceus]